MKGLLCLIFVAYVKAPFGVTKTYEKVKDVEIMPMGITLKLILSDGKLVYVPAMFTVVEEK